MTPRVLIITYYWPPTGGAGVHRWLKFVKYLRAFNWEPIVYTPANPQMPAIDETLLLDIPENLTVIKKNIREPYDLYKKFLGINKNEKINPGFIQEKHKPKIAEKISIWIRGNLFIPDARKFWINPSTKFLLKYLKENKINVIVSSGPPHSLHLIALKLHKKTKIPWLADFRDPWTEIDFYNQLMLTPIANRIHHKMEKKVLTTADRVVTISNNCALNMQKICNRNIDVITNGFDEPDFINNKNIIPDKFRISHIGALNRDRNPDFLWETLSELIDENSGFARDLQIELVGKTDISVMEKIKSCRLLNFTQKIDYLTHNEAVEHEFSAAVLLLLINNTPASEGIAPGKLFEYLATRRPVLCIGPENGDSATIITETNSGKVVPFNDKMKLKKTILELYANFKKGIFVNENSNIQKYQRRELTRQLADLLDSML